MFWLMAIWSFVIVVLLILYIRPGFRNASQILKGYGGPKVRVVFPPVARKQADTKPPHTD